jgi:hypothetical protein
MKKSREFVATRYPKRMTTGNSLKKMIKEGNLE